MKLLCAALPLDESARASLLEHPNDEGDSALVLGGVCAAWTNAKLMSRERSSNTKNVGGAVGAVRGTSRDMAAMAQLYE